MRPAALLFAFHLLIIAGCSSPEQKKDETPKETSITVDLAACEEAADEARADISALSDVDPSAGYDDIVASYRSFLDARRAWASDESICLVEGADVVERAQLHESVVDEFDTAEDAFVVENVERFLEGDLEKAHSLLAIRFATHRAIPAEVERAAYDVSRAYNDMLLKKFEETETYAQLAEKTTTCIFNTERIDPREEITPGFTTVFGGDGDVHALCRIPVPASKFGGDPKGKIVLLLDDDPNPEDEVIYEADLGSVEKWKETQFFVGRFSMPQGIPQDAEAAAYYVTVKVQRPELGDEYPVANSFLWFR